MTVTITFNLTMLLMVAANVLGIFAYVGLLRLRAHRLEQAKKRILAVVADNFASIGVAVSSEAIALPAGHFIIIADTEPLKRFRHSHIVEMVLIEKVKNATGKTVDRVYWRFPLPAREDAVVDAPENTSTSPPAPKIDAYLAQGLKRLRAPEGLEVHEDSWAHFQEVVHEREEAKCAADDLESGREPAVPITGETAKPEQTENPTAPV